MKRVAVFVPGIMGSELWLDRELIWPGGVLDMVFRYPHVSESDDVQVKGDELLSAKLRVGDVIRQVSVSAQYEALFQTLADCGLREDDNTLYPFPYDWRKNNADSAQGLAELLDRVAEKQPDEILLIAHSMGGLICRYYLESRTFDQRPGLHLVSSLICLATPHYGSPLALTAALGMERRVFLNEQQVYKLVRQSQFPSLYQLLPPPGAPFAWNRELKEKLVPVDIYEAGIGTRLCAYQKPEQRLNQENLDSAFKFRQDLDLSKRPPSVRYFFFAGTRQRSATTSLIIPSGDLLEVRNHEVDDGGDGTVPFWSASVTGMQVSAVGGEHGTIYKNEELIEVLKALLGARGMLAARATLPPELSVRDHVVDPGSLFPVALTFRTGVEEVSAEIRIEKLKDETDRTYGPALLVSQFEYKGALVERFSVVLKAPETPGVYRVAIYLDKALKASAGDDLFVQARLSRTELPSPSN